MDIQIRFPSGKPKALTISYDDGTTTDIRMVQTMKTYGIRGTFNINAGMFPAQDQSEGYPRICKETCKALYLPNGHEIASHCYTHPHIAQMDSAIAIHDMILDRIALESLTGSTVRGLAYPYNSFNDDMVEAVRLCGYSYARTTDTDENFRLPTDLLRWKPTTHHKNPRLMELCDKFLSGEPWDEMSPWLFLMWGHSHEFKRDDNWDVFDRFCEKMGGHDNIWYATNIEICDYLNAYKNLRFSADGSFAENPTTIDVWIMKDHRLYEIKSGSRVVF